MARIDMIPAHLLSPVGPTPHQYGVLLRAVLEYDNDVRRVPQVQPWVIERMFGFGWVTADGKVTKRGLVALLVLPLKHTRQPHTNRA